MLGENPCTLSPCTRTKFAHTGEAKIVPSAVKVEPFVMIFGSTYICTGAIKCRHRETKSSVQDMFRPILLLFNPRFV